MPFDLSKSLYTNVYIVFDENNEYTFQFTVVAFVKKKKKKEISDNEILFTVDLKSY